MNTLHRFRPTRIFAVVMAIALLLASPATSQLASAQDDPFGKTDFTSPKFGTEITWTEDWRVDADQSAIEQRRDILVLLSRDIDAGVFIELHSQRSFRNAETLLDTFMERFTSTEGFEILDDNQASYPPSLEFQSGEIGSDQFAIRVQAQAIDGAMMVVALLATPDDLDEAYDLAVDAIQVGDLALFDALPICGDTAAPADTGTPSAESEDSKAGGFGSSQAEATETAAAATPEPAESTSGTTKPGGFGSNDDATEEAGGDDDAAGECVAIVIPTPSTEETPEPTPTETSGRGGGLNNATYESPTFPGVSLQYNKTDWEVLEELPADENAGRDVLQLRHTDLAAGIYIETYAGHNGRASACIDLALREAGITPAENALIEDADGNLISGSQQGRVWGAYTYESDDVELGGYVECRAFSGDAGVIVITLIAGIDDFPDAYEDLQPILRSIVTG